jgi:catechol 2,3-dioxygenase
MVKGFDPWRIHMSEIKSVSIASVSLTVDSLAESLAYYQKSLGFQLIQQAAGKAELGAGSTRLLELVEVLGAPRAEGVTGLYHFAVVLPNRRELARLVLHLAQNEVEIQGVADHGVSESVYLADPEGNGIELYRDRHPNEWPRDPLGRLEMGTDELDVDDLMKQIKADTPPFEGMPEGTRIGHVHLHVADLAAAEKFYTTILGMDLVQRYGKAAAFLSWDGYHHHVGINTWAGVGAPPPPPGSRGLNWFGLNITPESKPALLERARTAGLIMDGQETGTLVLRDPSQNGVMLE